MKKWLSVAAVVVLCLALVMGIACSEEEETGVKKVKLGIGLPLTGVYAAFAGFPAKYGFELANDKIGEFIVDGERYRWDLIFEDNLMSTAGGVASANRFIYEHDVDFMFQSTADPGFASAMLTEEIGMILDIAAGGPFDYGPDKPHTFQSLNVWHLGTAPFFDWLTKEHPEVKRVATSYIEGELGATIADAIEGCCDYYGLELRASAHPMATVEYYPIATRIMADNPDLVIGVLPLFEVLWEMGYEGLCACYHWTEGTWGTALWDDAIGLLIYMPHPLGDLWPEVAAFAAEYEEAFGGEFTAASLQTLTLLYLYTDILKQAGTVDDVDKIIETMETGTFDTPVGPIHYGCEALNGIGHVAIWPSPVYEIVGESEYLVKEAYSPEEVEAIANEVYAER
jgi:ABC-type branched-subunit amino acid transport system substrate-binding protein